MLASGALETTSKLRRARIGGERRTSSVSRVARRRACHRVRDTRRYIRIRGRKRVGTRARTYLRRRERGVEEKPLYVPVKFE